MEGVGGGFTSLSSCTAAWEGDEKDCVSLLNQNKKIFLKKVLNSKEITDRTPWII